MRSILIVLIITVVISGRAYAQNLSATGGIEWAVSIPEGDGLEPAITVGVGMAISVLEKWVWFAELDVWIPATVFNPAPRLITGMGVGLNDRLSLSFLVLWQLNPPYGESKLTHMIGFGLSPFLSITKEISLGLAVGPGVLVGKGIDPIWSFAFEPLISFAL